MEGEATGTYFMVDCAWLPVLCYWGVVSTLSFAARVVGDRPRSFVVRCGFLAPSSVYLAHDCIGWFGCGYMVWLKLG